MENIKHSPEYRTAGSSSLGEPVIRVSKLRFSYKDGFSLVIDHLEIPRGARLALTGESGCGKTTFIRLGTGILQPEEGKIMVDALELTQYSEKDLRDIRILKMGLVFQEFELLDYLSILDNVLLPFRINPVLKMPDDAQHRAIALLHRVGLQDKTRRFPGNLSQGERQRVAVCRALVTQPSTLWCDEPTANLDVRNRDLIMDLILEYCQDHKATLVMVTHDQALLPYFTMHIDMNRFHHPVKRSSYEG